MISEIQLGNKTIKYILKKDTRAKRLRLTIRPGDGLIVTKPRLIPLFVMENFLKEKSTWILKKLKEVEGSKKIGGSRKDYLEKKELARKLVLQELVKFNSFYGFNFKDIRIKNQKTIWGSCSSGKNLNFNYKLVYLQKEELEYLVVHELCHLKEMNHSSKFWALVEKTLPEYKLIRKRLKKVI